MEQNIELKVYRKNTIAIIEMHGNDNRVNNLLCTKMLKALDQIEKWDDIKVLITTGTGKFYSNGLDLNYLMSDEDGENRQEKFKVTGQNLALLYNRILTFPMLTIAALNGHCFAGGFLIAMAHDYRIMQEGRGFICMNEIDTGLPVNFEISEIVRNRIHPNLMRDILVFGKRFDASLALKLGIIDKITPQGKALEVAIEFGEAETKNRTYSRLSLQSMKEIVYKRFLFDNILVSKL